MTTHSKTVEITDSNKDSIFYQTYYELLQESDIFENESRIVPYSVKNKFGTFVLNKTGSNSIRVGTPHGNFNVTVNAVSGSAEVGSSVKIALPIILANNYFVLNGNLFGMLGDHIRVSMMTDQSIVLSVNNKGITRKLSLMNGNYETPVKGEDFIRFHGPYISGYTYSRGSYYSEGDFLNGNIIASKDSKRIAYPYVFRLREMKDKSYMLNDLEDMTETEKFLAQDPIIKHSFPYIIIPNVYCCIINDSSVTDNFLHSTIRIGYGRFYIFSEEITGTKHMMMGFRL